MAEFVIKKEEIDKFTPARLSQSEREDLAAITRHPGLRVLLERIMATHVGAQLNRIHDVDLDDPHRSTKLDAICAVAHAMSLNLALTKLEIDRNWKELLKQEEVRAQKAKDESESPQ